MTLMEIANDWLPVLTYVGPPLCGWIWWSANQRFAKHEDVSALSSRLASVEAGLKELPDAATMHKVELALEEIRGDMRAQRARMDGMDTHLCAINNNVEMLVQNHMKEYRRGTQTLSPASGRVPPVRHAALSFRLSGVRNEYQRHAGRP